MKLLVDNDVLSEMFEKRLSGESDFAFFKQLVQSGEVELWTSTLSVMELCRNSGFSAPRPNLKDVISFCETNFTTIPLRLSAFCRAKQDRNWDVESQC